MDCPVCKYPNAAGATHCGMCYEVFNRSAADAYLQAMKRERREEEGGSTPTAAPPKDDWLKTFSEWLKTVDWQRLKAPLLSLWKRAQFALAIGASLIVVWLLGGWLFSPDLWYHVSGKKLYYAYPSGDASAYMVSTTEKIRTWSERGGRLDTPLEEFQIEEFGNVFFHSETSTVKNQIPVTLRVKEWIQILHDIRQPTSSGIPLSRTIPLKHPSLAEGHFVIKKKGAMLERRPALSVRVGKALPFLAPQFPEKAIHPGSTWSERVEWMDIYNDWKIRWIGTLHWTAGDLSPCFSDTCVRLTYRADLRPQLWGTPPWAAKTVHEMEAQISTEGVALFDATHKRLTSNLFSYDGILRLPIKDLARIPSDLRVGRRVKKTPGDIVIRFENKIDLHKN